MQTPLLAGRDFTESDTTGSPKVAVVNEAFARKEFGDATRLGRRVVDGTDEFEIIGIVGNSKRYTIREDFRPIVYSAASQVEETRSPMRFVIRSRIGIARRWSRSDGSWLSSIRRRACGSRRSTIWRPNRCSGSG